MAGKSNESQRGAKDIFAALNHPLRRRVLRTMVLRQRTTPKDVADELAENLGNVSYHVRYLAACRVVTLVRADSTRGWERHVYEVTTEERWVREALGLPASLDGRANDEPEEAAVVHGVPEASSE